MNKPQPRKIAFPVPLDSRRETLEQGGVTVVGRQGILLGIVDGEAKEPRRQRAGTSPSPNKEK